MSELYAYADDINAEHRRSAAGELERAARLLALWNVLRPGEFLKVLQRLRRGGVLPLDPVLDREFIERQSENDATEPK